jgi:hypothetical protein
MRRKPLIPALAVLLAVQLLLGLWLWSGGQSMAPARTQLLTFDPSAVDGIELSDGKGKSVRLSKHGDQWQLPASFGFPAAGSRVKVLLNTLAHLKPGLAVATTTPAASRFHVADKDYKERIRLLAGDRELAVLYLGDAQGPRHSYGRAGHDSTIYPLLFSSYQAEPRLDAWLDKSYLHRAPAKLSAVQLGDLKLTHKGDAWQLTDLAAGEQTDAKAAADLVRRLTLMQFMAVQGKADKAPADKVLLTASLTFSNGKDGKPRTVAYRFMDPGKGGDPVLWVSDRDYLLRVASFDFKPLSEMSRDKLVKSVAVQAPADTSAPSQATGSKTTGTDTQQPPAATTGG